MIDPTESLEEIDRLVECFVEERRTGRCESIESFIERYPRWAEQLQELLPTVSILEHCGGAASNTLPTLLPDIPNYRFSHELGRGGMGIVYQAEHLALGRQVAVKLLSSNMIQNAKAQERFQREARATARMHQSNIVPVFEVGQHNGISFYSMQLIVGRNLDEHIRELAKRRESDGRAIQVPEHYRQVASLGIRIARALHYAHQRNVLHRDLKPSNILIDDDNAAWLSDFGLASILDERVAMSEDLAGTLRYLAPERLQGKCDCRSDIYSLGLTLHEYITLSPAFGKLHRSELISPNRPVPCISQMDPLVPRDLATIIEKSCRHDVDSRYSSAEEMAIDLQKYLDGNPISARPVSSPERLWMWSKRNPSLAAMTFSLNLEAV